MNNLDNKNYLKLAKGKSIKITILPPEGKKDEMKILPGFPMWEFHRSSKHHVNCSDECPICEELKQQAAKIKLRRRL